MKGGPTATEWPADHVARWPLAKLSAAAINPRTHSPEQVGKISRSMEEFGWTNPILVDETGRIIAGHGRVLAAHQLGWKDAPVMVAKGWSDQQKRAYLLADNKLALDAGWDEELLRGELKALKAEDFDLLLTGFSDIEIKQMALFEEAPVPNENKDVVPDPPAIPVTCRGDVWILGSHRIRCGDARNADDVEELMNGQTAQLLHADPPYGMGKEADGVLNDNLRGDRLDKFQLQWWKAFRRYLTSNASAYIWGTAPALWRLWYAGGLEASEPMTICNEIVWDKKSIAGMKSPDINQFPQASERALFFQLGRCVLLVNQTKQDYWPGWEPIRTWLCKERDRMKWKSARIKEICGNHMHGHWFVKSQWSFISQENYEKLQAAAEGKAFVEPYKTLQDNYERLLKIFNGEATDTRSVKDVAVRPYFDNAHETMRDVWEHRRVAGEERFGHATPKPVDMMERVMNSSLRAGELCAEPFLGTGSTLIAAEKTGRRCFGMELEPAYCDIVIQRWQELSGQAATLEENGHAFETVRNDRQ